MPVSPQAAAPIPKTDPRPNQSVRGPKLWVFRIVTLMVLPVLALCCLEIALRLGGYGYPTSFFLKQDISGRKVLVENDKFGWRFFGSARSRTPRPMEIPVIKAPGTCRIFVFGESAAYG